MVKGYIIIGKLDHLRFSIHRMEGQDGQSLYEGNYLQTACYLEANPLDNLIVAVRDLEQDNFIDTIPAADWMTWYYQIAVPELEAHEVNESVLIPYPNRYVLLYDCIGY